MEFCDQSGNCTNIAPEFYQICMFFPSIKKLSIGVESLHFPAKCCECNLEQRDGHGKSRNAYGKVTGKCFLKSVGTLNNPCTIKQTV